ncbi:retropepsin-like aspartic protease [Sphingomonas asaccharolytica]|uniref:retropepsin-like aspartic protease n=1 Tax=Sphingomonas asaccharolytica TaxID=40681 RepID=UPI000A054CA2|nr:retropepsin-like aspartic protease [Sphingomonas asaccharolytica]
MIATLALLLAQTALPQPNVYAPPPKAGTAERLAYDAQLGGAAEDAAIEAWLAVHADAPAALRAMLFHRLCNDYGVTLGGEKRVTACAEANKLAPDGEDASDEKIAEAFRAAPPIRAHGGATVATIANPLGSKSANVTVNGITLPWFMDTGAEISVVTESTAAKLGVRVLPGSSDVGTSTSNRVTGKLGVIDKATIGAATVENLPVLILPDAMLKLGKDYTIPAIFGLPAFAALGRIAWLDGGARLALGSAAPMPKGKTVRVYWHEDGLGIPITTAVGTMGAQFDSGADSTDLRKPGLALLTTDQIASATERNTTVGGAGGFVTTKVRVLPRLDYSIGDIPLTAFKVDIDDSEDGAGRIGSDMIAQLKLLTIDFATMTLQASPLK